MQERTRPSGGPSAACSALASDCDSQRAFASARSQFPDIVLDEVSFAAWVLERVPEGVEARELFAKHGADLYVACACCRGDAAAFEVFERLYGGELDAVARRLRLSRDRGAELKQHVRERLFVRQGERAPKIAEYRGTGALRNWVRSVAMRVGLNDLNVPAHRVEPLEDVLFDTLEDCRDDIEMSYMKATYRTEFRRSFAEAFEALCPRDRNLLRYTLSEDLEPAELGVIYNVHRTTASRWLGEARRALMAAVRSSMMRRLKLSGSDFESVLRLIRSTLEFDKRITGIATEASTV